MTEEDGVAVTSTIHAADRALERFPHLRGCTRPDASRWLERTTLRALRAGRKARRAPRWCVREDEEGFRRRGRASTEGTSRFVWNEQETAALVVRRTRMDATPGKPAKSIWLVLTVLARPAA